MSSPHVALALPAEFVETARAHRIDIIPTRLAPAGRTYAVHYRGELLCESRTPRVCVLQGAACSGRDRPLEVWRPGRPCADIRLDIDKGAGLTISETDKRSLQIVGWSPHPRSAVLYASGEPPAATALQEVG